MKNTLRKSIFGVVLAVLIGALGWYLWQQFAVDKSAQDFVSSNGRLEATEIKVAAKMAGRVDKILVNEGDLVQQNDVLAVMELTALQAQLLQAQAEAARAVSAKEAAIAQVAQRSADIAVADAVLLQRASEQNLAQKTTERSQALLKERATSAQEADNDQARLTNAKALVTVAKAQILTAHAALRAATSQVTQAQANIAATDAAVARIKSDLADGVLRAPRSGRVQFRVVQPGEVVGNGGVVLSLVDLNDVYMTFFLPSALAGKIAVGADVRLVLDAASNYVIPAKISFVASVAQFTPKMVETQNEREKMVFRVKARISPELLIQHIAQVKTGLPGMAYVQLNPNAAWATQLQTKLP